MFRREMKAVLLADEFLRGRVEIRQPVIEGGQPYSAGRVGGYGEDLLAVESVVGLLVDGEVLD